MPLAPTLLTIATLSAPLAPQPHPNEPIQLKLPATSTAPEWNTADHKGHWIALHFLAQPTSPECQRFVADVSTRAPTLAAFTQVFIVTSTADDLSSLTSAVPASAKFTYLDVASDARRAFNLPTTTVANPVTILLDDTGREIARHTGATAHDHQPFNNLSRELESKRSRSSLKEYNLPKPDAPAVQGYDVVAYFTDNKAVEGKPELTSRFRGVTYRFATADHRAKFNADPARYEPTYGGWCASAMGAKGTKVEIDPTNFKVKNNRLFLFYKDFFSDALKEWNKHESEWEPAADTNWKKTSGESPTSPRTSATR